MSTDRISKKAGWVNPKTLPKGPNGRNLCRRCQVEVPRGRRTFCSDACIDQWKIKTDPGYVRSLVKFRDKGICADCGRDCVALQQELQAQNNELKRNWSIKSLKAWEDRIACLKSEGFAALNTFWYSVTEGSFWQADHIVPVVEGGGECDLSNYRTLCTPCHKAATKALRQRMKERKQNAKQLGLLA